MIRCVARKAQGDLAAGYRSPGPDLGKVKEVLPKKVAVKAGS